MSEGGFLKTVKENYDNIEVKIKNLTLLKTYDFFVYLSRNYPHKFSNRLIRQTCRRFGLKNKKILDVGSYTGYYSFYFHCERNRVVGVELSNKADYAKKRYGNYSIEFIQGDINQVLSEMDDEKFDFIFCSNLPLHYDTGSVLTSAFFDDFIDKALKRLNDNGIFYYIFYSSKHDKVAIPVEAGDLTKYCINKGLKNYSVETTRLLKNDTVELVVKQL